MDEGWTVIGALPFISYSSSLLKAPLKGKDVKVLSARSIGALMNTTGLKGTKMPFSRPVFFPSH